MRIFQLLSRYPSPLFSPVNEKCNCEQPSFRLNFNQCAHSSTFYFPFSRASFFPRGKTTIVLGCNPVGLYIGRAFPRRDGFRNYAYTLRSPTPFAARGDTVEFARVATLAFPKDSALYNFPTRSDVVESIDNRENKVETRLRAQSSCFLGLCASKRVEAPVERSILFFPFSFFLLPCANSSKSISLSSPLSSMSLLLARSLFTGTVSGGQF